MPLARLRVLTFALVLPASASAATGVYSGRVLSVEERPVAGAEVALYALETGPGRAERLMLGRARPALGSTRTAPDGTFRLDAAADVGQVEARADGYGPLALTALAGEPLTVELKPARLLKGAVTGSGRPVGGATLVWTGAEDPGGSSSEYVVKSDPAGSYEVPDPATWAGGVVVFHPDFALSSTGGHFLDLSLPLRHELGAGKPVAGKVVAPPGSPTGAVTLWLDGWPAGKTNPDGTFLIPHGPPSPGMLVAKTSTLVGRAQTGAGPVTIELQQGRTVAGTVRDARTRAPLVGAVVRLMGDEDAWPATALSDERGRYEFTPLSPGRYFATAARRGYTPQYGDYAEDQLIDLRRLSSRTRDFALQRQSRLTGRVVDDGGRPIEGALVALLPKGSPTFYVRGESFAARGSASRTSADGTFSLAYDAPEAARGPAVDGPLIALKEGYAATRIEGVERGRASHPVVVTLVRGVALEGRVVSEDGRALSDVGVVIAEDATVPGATMPVHAMLRGYAGEGWVKTGPDGRFAARVRPGPHDLAFRKPGYVARLVTAHDPAAGDALEAVLAPALGLRGSVVTAEGVGVAGVTIYVRQASGEMATAATGEDGSFSVEELSPGPFDLYAMKEGTGINASRQGEVPSPDVRIELPRLGALRGRVVDAKSGAPVTTFDVGTTPADAGEWTGGVGSESVSDAAGQFLLTDVPVGEVTVRVQAEGYVGKEAPAVVSPDGQDAPPVEIALEAGIPVHGRVMTSAGEPLADVTVTAQGTAEDEEATAETDEGGSYRFPGLPPGTVTLHFQRTGYVSAKKSFDTADTTRVDATLARGLSVKGVVLSGGAGVAQARVHAFSSAADAENASAMSGEGGAFTLDGLTPGRYTVSAASADEGEATLEHVDVEKAGLLRLVLERKPTTVLTGVVTGLPPGDSSLMTRVVATGEEGASGQAPVDGRGAFRMEKAPVGRVRVQAFTASMSGDSRSSRANDLTLVAGSESQTVLEFRSDVVISGRITRDGSPLAGGVAFFRAADGSGGMANSRVGGGGDYEVIGLEPGPHEVTVSGSGMSHSYSTEYFVRESAQFDIDATGVAVRGQTVDATDGSPLAGVEVSLWREAETKPSQSQTTNVKGEFVARGLREGRYRVLTSKKGYGQQVRELALESGGSADVVLELAASEGLTLTVVDARDGRALEATVVVRDLARRVIANQHSGVEADGSLNIPLTAGRYLLSTSASGYGTATVPVTAPGRGLRVGLTPGGTLVVDSERDLRGRIRLVRPDGEEYVRCWCNGIADIPLTGRHTKVENVTPGTYSIQLLDHAGVARTGPTVVLEEGRVATVNVE